MRYMATIGSDFHAKDMVVDIGKSEDRPICLQIWDTAGQERFQSLGVAYYRGSDGCILVYDVNSQDSFTNLKNWMNEFLIQAQPRDVDSFPIVVIGNKVDMGTKDRQVTKTVANKWCFDNGQMPYFETSAKDNLEVDAPFQRVARMMVEQADKEDREPYQPSSAERPIKLTEQSSGPGKLCCSG
eukprot:EG_transcript_19917